MALTTVTVAKKIKGRQGPVLIARVSFAGDAAYTTGGSDFKAKVLAALGLTNSNYDIVGATALDCGGYMPAYVPSNGKLKVYFGDYNPAAEGPFVEVANAANLGAVTFNMTLTLG
jgi:hypothetical protein